MTIDRSQTVTDVTERLLNVVFTAGAPKMNEETRNVVDAMTQLHKSLIRQMEVFDAGTKYTYSVETSASGAVTVTTAVESKASVHEIPKGEPRDE